MKITFDQLKQSDNFYIKQNSLFYSPSVKRVVEVFRYTPEPLFADYQKGSLIIEGIKPNLNSDDFKNALKSLVSKENEITLIEYAYRLEPFLFINRAISSVIDPSRSTIQMGDEGRSGTTTIKINNHKIQMIVNNPALTIYDKTNNEKIGLLPPIQATFDLATEMYAVTIKPEIPRDYLIVGDEDKHITLNSGDLRSYVYSEKTSRYITPLSFDGTFRIPFKYLFQKDLKYLISDDLELKKLASDLSSVSPSFRLSREGFKLTEIETTSEIAKKILLGMPVTVDDCNNDNISNPDLQKKVTESIQAEIDARDKLRKDVIACEDYRQYLDYQKNSKQIDAINSILSEVRSSGKTYQEKKKLFDKKFDLIKNILVESSSSTVMTFFKGAARFLTYNKFFGEDAKGANLVNELEKNKNPEYKG